MKPRCATASGQIGKVHGAARLQDPCCFALSGISAPSVLVLVRAIQGLATPGDVLLAIGLAAQMHGVVSQAVGYGTVASYGP